MSDGDYPVSMRHLSVIVKIARTDHDGFIQGDIVWRLGGRLSDFDLSSDSLLGPCAQHTASDVTPTGRSDHDHGLRQRILRRQLALRGPGGSFGAGGGSRPESRRRVRA
ncbi:hypothetical protein [Nocardioides sp. B-3]|uniref:hypothetical protein n=1 Tax=Nocardioides sp. B-3 TaxID=2895565 RepID=UPI003FA594D9